MLVKRVTYPTYLIAMLLKAETCIIDFHNFLHFLSVFSIQKTYSTYIADCYAPKSMKIYVLIYIFFQRRMVPPVFFEERRKTDNFSFMITFL